MPAKIETTICNGALNATTQEIIQERLEEFAKNHRRLKELHVSIDVDDPARPVVEIEAPIGEQKFVSKASAGNVGQAVDDAIGHLRGKLAERLQGRRDQNKEQRTPEDRDDRFIKVGGGVAVVLLAGIVGFAILRVLAGSSDGMNRGSVDGNVTLDGKPVEQGMISLTPTSGTTGPAAYGVISDGKYSILAAERGPVVGRQQVKIVANRETGETNDSGPVIEQYIPSTYNRETTIEVDIASGENTHNFELSSE